MTSPRRRLGRDLMATTLIQLAILIAFGALLAATVLSDRLVATQRPTDDAAALEQAAASAADDARSISRVFFGVDPAIETGSPKSMSGDIAHIARSLALFKDAMRSAEARRQLSGRTLPDVWTDLATARDRAESLERSLGAVESALEGVGGPPDMSAKVADLVAHNRELQIRNIQLIGQLANLERRAGTVGKPPCWVTPDGRAEYTYKITITDLDFLVEPIWPQERIDDIETIGAPPGREPVRYADEDFSRAMYPFLAFGIDSDPECRFFVQVVDQTGPFKGAWQRRLALVEGYFYKFWVK